MRTLAACLCLSLCANSFAGVPTYDFKQPVHDGVTLVGLECHKKNATLELGLFYSGAPPTKRMDLWRTLDLIAFDKETYMVQDTFEVERHCTIADERFVVKFRGLPGAANMNWLCGAAVTAHATVWKSGKLIFDEDLERCDRKSEIRSVKFVHGSDAPEVTRSTD